MARTSLAQQEQFSKLSGQKLSVSKIAVPFTQIINRARINDLANDLGMRLGVERIQTQSIYQIQNEFGPTGQPVFGAVGDTFDQIRFVGAFYTTTTTSGSRVESAVGDFIEITFFGTGLNILSSANAIMDIRASVDGGAEGANISPSAATTIDGRGCAPNTIFPVVSGLSAGVHTVKLRMAASVFRFTGFEIINQASTLNIRPGSLLKDGQKFNIASADLESFNSGFESGTLGTRGGRVLVYAKPDGTIAKAVNPANSSAAYLTSADHSNEEVIRTYNLREFGANRADDWSTATSSLAARVFTLDDGVTTLVGTAGMRVSSGGSLLTPGEYLNADGVGDFFTLTFIGTGLDVSITPFASFNETIFVDGVSIGSPSAPTDGYAYNIKICSGLPYGTHTVKFLSNAVFDAYYKDFVVYGPKKPALPVGAAEIGEYYLMADYVIKTSNSMDFISTGVLRKMSNREMTYAGTWSGPTLNVNGVADSGWYILSATAASYVQYTFFGTGFEYKTHFTTAQTFNQTVTVNGSSNLSSFTTSIITSSPVTFTAATGLISGSGAGHNGIIRVSGLPLGVHTVRVTQNNSASNMYVDLFDIITPVHVSKFSDVALQNAANIGSCGVRDLRELPGTSDNAKLKVAFGVASFPTTTSTARIPMPDMNVSYYSEGEYVEINFFTTFNNSLNVPQDTYFVIVIDGVRQQGVRESLGSGAAANMSQNVALNLPAYLSAGFHSIQVWWSVDAGTAEAVGVTRQLSVKRIGK